MSISPASIPYTEPWLRGTHTDVPAAGRAVLHALELAWDDIQKWAEDLTEAEAHASPLGLTPVAVQIEHICGSVDRILTYAEGNQLSNAQLTALKSESAASGTLAESMGHLQTTLARAASRIRALAAADLEQPRTVGRKQLPTSTGGALIHVADHTQRHVGQIVTTAKAIMALRGK